MNKFMPSLKSFANDNDLHQLAEARARFFKNLLLPAAPNRSYLWHKKANLDYKRQIFVSKNN